MSKEPPVLEVLPALYPQTQFALGDEFLRRELVLKPQESVPKKAKPDPAATS